MRSSDLKKETRILKISGKGQNKKDAIANSFVKFRKKVEETVDGVIIRIDPMDVLILDVEKNTIKKKFLELFWVKEVITYSVNLEVQFELKYI